MNRLSLYYDDGFCQAVMLPEECVEFMLRDLEGQAREGIVLFANDNSGKGDIDVFEVRKNVGMVWCAVVIGNQPCGYCGSCLGDEPEVYDWPRCANCGGC